MCVLWGVERGNKSNFILLLDHDQPVAIFLSIYVHKNVQPRVYFLSSISYFEIGFNFVANYTEYPEMRLVELNKNLAFLVN